MMTRSLSTALILVLALATTGLAQTGRAPGKGKQTTGTTSPDSLKAYMRALSRKDSTALRRYNASSGPAAHAEGPRSAHIALLARTSPDSIQLRWAPSKPGAWIEANRFGYLIDRVTMTKQGKVVPGSMRRLTPAPLKPWTLDEWKARARPDNRFAAVAAQALYGESFKQSTDVPPGVAMNAGTQVLEGRFGFALFAADNDPLVAQGLGLRYVDHDVKQGEQYVYRVRLAIKDTSYHLDTAYAAASPVSQPAPPKPPGLSAEGLDRHITLHWNEFGPGLAYSGYNVERSEDGGKTYIRLNQNPVVTPYRQGAREKLMPSYSDTTVVNYRKYRYRVRGITPFAELSAPAEITAYGTDRTPPPHPVIGKPEQISRRSVRLTWQIPDTVKDLAGFVVSRSATNMEGYHPITVTLPKAQRGKQLTAEDETRSIMKQLLPPVTRSFTDVSATSAEPYYMVGAVDTSGNLSYSLPAYAAIIDSVPPRTPVGLAGRIDTSGIVHLHWHLGPEPNIIGYRVLWANDPRHEFTQRTPQPVKDTVYADTINLRTLTRYIYYRIAAVNDRFIHSPLSPILALRRPDVVPPGSPVFTNVHVSDSSVTLLWAPSSSDDVKQQILYRRKAGEAGWGVLASLRPPEMSYVDRKVTQRTMYEYTLEAVDSSGLKSKPAVPVQGRPYDTGVRPGISGLDAKLDAKKGIITLSWRYPASPKERYWFIIYRAFGTTGLTEYQSVSSTAHSFADTMLVGKGSYRYAVRVKMQNGGQSPISTPVTVLYNK